MARRVLFIYNDPAAPEALLGDVFGESGFDVSTFEVVPADRTAEPHLDVTFPDPTGFDAIVPLGSRWSVNDDLPWIASESEMVATALHSGVGVLGVCFGGQLLARTLGGSVARSPHPEIGWYDVHSAQPDVVPHGPWFQWHFDRITLPPGAVEVARNDRATQAFRHGRALGLQFHPEVDSALVNQWIDEDDDQGIAGLGLDVEELQRRTATEIDDAARRLRLLVRGFLGLLDDQRLH